jgi:TonB family protein
MTGALLFDLAAVSAVLGLGLLATRIGRRSAAERHGVLAACVVCALAAPALRLAVPASWAARLDVRPASATATTTRPPAVELPAATSPTPPSDLVETVRPRAAAPTEGDGSWRRGALGLWLAGVGLAFGRLLAGLLRLRRITWQATPLDGGPWRQTADALSTALGLRRRVGLVVTGHPSLLATWGWRRPTIALPRQALGWPTDRIHAVLAHELAHVGRGDWLHQLAGEALRALYWPHPLAWQIRRRLLDESERASDDAVLALGLDNAAYAGHLVDLARQLTPCRSPWLPAPAMARISSLEGRLLAMLDPATRRGPLSRSARGRIFAAALAATLPFALLGAAAQFHALRGSLHDPSDRVLPGAAVTLTDAAAGRSYQVRSDGAGRFEFVGLPPAAYRLEVKTPGFQIHVEDVTISSDVERALRLRVGTVQETITVVDDGRPDAPPDGATVARREATRQRAGQRQQRALATCAAGPPVAVGGNILPPMKIVHVTPRYQEHLRPSGAAGVVTMQAVIDTAGQVGAVRNVRGPHPDFEAAAVTAVRAWEFTPTLLTCEPIEVEMAATVNFSPAP